MMKRTRSTRFGWLTVAILLCACDGAAGGAGDASAAAVTDRGEAVGTAAATNDDTAAHAAAAYPCDLLTAHEVRSIGRIEGPLEVEAESNDSGDHLCGWANGRQDFVVLEVSPCTNAPDGTRGACAWLPSGAEQIPGIGVDAWIVPGMEPFSLGVWTASAWTGDRLVSVNVRSPSASAEAAASLLRAAMQRF